MFSEKALKITDVIYKMYGTDSGILFGMPKEYRNKLFKEEK
jgi:hypothetical protein